MSDLKDTLNELNNTPDSTPAYDPADISANTAMGVLAYLGWLVLIPLLAAKESRFARFHSNQGLILAIVESVVAAVVAVLKCFPLIGWVFGLAGAVFSLACTVLAIVGIVNVLNGRVKELPLIGGFRILSE